MTLPSDDYFIEMMSSCWMMTESEELTPGDKIAIRQNLNRLKSGAMQKIPPMMSFESGLRNIFLQFDKDRTGFITINELNVMCLKLGVPLERKYTMNIMK